MSEPPGNPSEADGRPRRRSLLLSLLNPLVLGTAIAAMIPRPVVGLIYLRDAIHAFSSAEMIAQIQYAREQPEIRAVVLVIDSPGGTLRAAGIELIFPEESLPDGDRLVLGLFEPDPDLEDYLAPLEITLPPDDPEGLLHVPGFGALNPAGIGVVGVARDEGGTTLALLAEDAEQLVSLLESMGLDLLEGCLVQGAYGLCKVGEGDGFGAADELDEFEFDLEFEEVFSE